MSNRAQFEDIRMKEIIYVTLVAAIAIGITSATSQDIRTEFERTERIEQVVETLPIQKSLEHQRLMQHD